jgi:hypothetical protein
LFYINGPSTEKSGIIVVNHFNLNVWNGIKKEEVMVRREATPPFSPIC